MKRHSEVQKPARRASPASRRGEMHPFKKKSKAAVSDIVLPYRPGESPETDAWVTAFFIENHLDHYTFPLQAATPEQVRFIVYTDEDERYYPCSDHMFEAIISRTAPDFLHQQYKAVLERILRLIDEQIEKDWEKRYLKALITIKYQHETRDHMMIPSRLEKRLLGIFINRTQIDDPYLCEKALRNRRVKRIVTSGTFQRAINRINSSYTIEPPETLNGIRELVDYLEFRRLLSLSVEYPLWEGDRGQHYSETDFLQIFNRPITGNGGDALLEFLGITNREGRPNGIQGKKILWLADESGEVMIDFEIIRYLAHRGHKIIVAFKDGPLFTKVDFYDVQEDEVINAELEGVYLIEERAMSKNDLVRTLRSDHRVFALSDGTRENLNFILTSTTFARIFKEVDGVISRGRDQYRRLYGTHFQFTQDIFNISRADDGSILVSCKPKHPLAIKFSHADLERKARAIIDEMERAKRKGMTIMFYSGIIGSIPGKIKTAKTIMSIFIQYLKAQGDMTFVINPSEYYEPGMDADDLMYMWEIVQRSGYIDIWRFQTSDDIVVAFQTLGEKVPPEWMGKDATFSTGCTKEMRIALEVQEKNPEMQIIGPAKEKFVRRAEYGIGKMYDKRLGELCQL